MKVFSAPAIAALESGEVMTSGAVKIATAEPFRIWGGVGVLEIDGEDYLGIGDAGLVTVSGAQLGGTEDGVELSLSGVDPTVVDLSTTTIAKNCRTTLHRLMFDLSGTTLLHAEPYDRGRMDRLSWRDTPGGTATIKASAETAARGLGRRTGQTTSDAGQRMIDGDDGSLKRVTQAGELTVAWGGKPPARAASSLPGGSPFPFTPGTDLIGVFF